MTTDETHAHTKFHSEQQQRLAHLRVRRQWTNRHQRALARARDHTHRARLCRQGARSATRDRDDSCAILRLSPCQLALSPRCLLASASAACCSRQCSCARARCQMLICVRRMMTAWLGSRRSRADRGRYERVSKCRAGSSRPSQKLASRTVQGAGPGLIRHLQVRHARCAMPSCIRARTLLTVRRSNSCTDENSAVSEPAAGAASSASPVSAGESPRLAHSLGWDGA